MEGIKPWYKGKVWYFLNSLKLTLFVLITLAVVSIFGTIVEQNQPVENYLSAYGEKWTRVLLYVHANDLFHSWWFLALLTLLAINIIVCTFERFPPKWKSLLNHVPESKFDSKLIERFSNNQTVQAKASASVAKERIEATLKKRKFKFVSLGSEGDWSIYAWKGAIGRLGSDFTHISLLLILLGAIVGSFAGYKDFRAVFVGDTLSLPKAGFDLRLDKFWIDYYDSGQIKQYNSLLTVVENGKDVMQKQIWVNEPLYYKGVRFYQSSYGMAWSKVADARIALKKKNKESHEDPVIIPWETLTRIPGSKYSVKVVGYTADFAYDEKTNQVFSKSAEADNPAVKLEVYEGDKLVSTPWLFMKYPGIFPAIPNSDEDLVFVTFKPVMYSGLSVNRDPGTNIVWAGSIVMGIGFYLAFFVYHRRVWIQVRTSGKSSEVKLGGMINKNNFVLEKELKEIADSVSTE
ncbi:MAG TPA: cytochrome c biogenesis protein ResB [Thermodesulfobacteriota bacterium]|nr:cytochrome c biogenesis protein ResB [Thermodesulfobacteriota bacterium]